MGLEALTKAGQDHLAKAGQDGQKQPRKGDNQATEEQVPAQEKEAEEKEKKEVEPEKEKETETQEDMKGNEKEDKVEAALKTMQAMGFSDDGGWLSNLLRAKSGDVSKVLDTIQPFKN